MPLLRKSALIIASALILFTFRSGIALAQNSGDDDKAIDVQTPTAGAHLGNDADPRQTGLPVFPHARLRKHEDSRNSANLSFFTTGFGIKLVVLNFDSDAAPDKVVTYYRDKLKKFGKVLECHRKDGHSDFNLSNDDDKSDHSGQLRCEGDDTGNVVELKVGTEDDQHIVAIAPAENGNGSTFALVYLHTRGKQGDI
jgi:hypothetical protein